MDHTKGGNQKLLTGPDPKVPRLEAPKTKPQTDFYVAPDGATFSATDFASTSGNRGFKPGELDIHYGKHGQEVAGVLGEVNYTKKQYLSDANYVDQNGTYNSTNHAYYLYAGRNVKDRSMYAVVGLDRGTQEITTFHVKDISRMKKWDPNLGFNP